MKLKNINLTDFRSVRKADLDFKDGFNLISGANGAGKSSVQLALAYLLYGHTIKNIDDYINWDSEGFDISTTLEHESKNYSISANRFKKKTKKSLSINDDIYSDSDVDAKLAEDFDVSLSKSSFLAFQGENDLISATPSVRREMLKKIYNLDFKEQLDKLEEEKKELEVQEKEINNKYLSLKGKEFKFLEMKKLPFSEADYQKHKNDLEKINKDLDELKIKQHTYNECKENVDKKINELVSKLSELTALDNIITGKRVVAENSISKNKKEIEDINLKLTSKSYEDTLKEYELEFKDITIQRLPSFSEDKLNKLIDFKYSLDNLKNNLENHIKLLEQGKCPTCGNDFDVKDLDSEKTKLEEIKKDIIENDEKIRNERSLKEEYDRAFSLNESLKSKKIVLESKIAGEAEKITLIVKQYEEKILSLKDGLKQFEDSLLEYNKSLQDNKKSRQEFSIELERINKEKEELPSSSDFTLAIDELVNKKSELEEHISDQDQIISTNKQLKLENDKIEKDKKETEDKLKTFEIAMNNIVSELSSIKEAVDIYKKKFPNYVINLMLKSIENGMNDFLSKTYEGRYTVKIIESKQGIDIVYGQNDASASLASGAEKDLMNIGLKIAYNKLANLKVLFLDEIDHMMSLDKAQKVFNVIYSMYESGTFNQVIIISHKPDIKEMIENEYRAKVFEIN